MPGFLFEKPFPGATSGIVIGPLTAADLAPLIRLRHLQWWVDGDGLGRRPNAFDRHGNVETVRIDQLPATELRAKIERFLGRDPRHLPSVFVTTDTQDENRADYATGIEQITAVLSSNHVARETRQKDGFTWQKHVLQNIPALVHRRLPSAWRDAFRGQPAFVCGAGPSLDVTAPLLSRVANRGVVLAADSAQRALTRHGVKVDFTVSVDAAKHPEKCLPADSLPGNVVLSSVSPPAWRDALPVERCFFLSAPQVTEGWLSSHGITPAAVAVRENCGGTALELARFLGCAPIYLFGLDLAVDTSNPSLRHNAAVDATIYTHSGFNPTQPLPTVPGNYSDRVPTFAAADWRALDERIAGWPSDLVYNINDRGARFRNTLLVHPKDFTLVSMASDETAVTVDLSGPEAPDRSALNTIGAELMMTAEQASRQVAPMHAALSAHGSAGVAPLFRQFLTDRNNAQIFGAFSFKLMPHLLPPAEGDDVFWRTCIEEFDQLAQIATASAKGLLEHAPSESVG